MALDDDAHEEVVIRVVLKKGADRDQFAKLANQAICDGPAGPAVNFVYVDPAESVMGEETRPITAAGGLQLEETRRLYVRFGPRPDERLHLARQQFSMLGMLMNTPTVRGTKNLMERLRAWDPFTWAESNEGSATKVYSRLTEALDQLARRMGIFETGIYRLTRRKGVYGFMGVIRENARGRMF